MPGNVPSKLTAPDFAPFAIDSGMLTGGMTLYLSAPRGDYLKGGLCSVNCKSENPGTSRVNLTSFITGDIKGMELHKEEIVERGLPKTAFLNAKLGPQGHPWELTA